MSSSTKMNGPGIPRTNQTRKAAEQTTIAASHAQSGTRATRARTASATEVDLGEAPRDLRGLGGARCDADVGGGLADLAEHVVRDSPAAGDELERSRLALRGVRE